MAPIIVVLLLLVVGLGRYAHGKQLVEQAAAAAARAASLSGTAGQARDRALEAAGRSLGDAGVSCVSMSAAVDTGSFRAGGSVTVTLECTADLSGLALSGLPGLGDDDRDCFGSAGDLPPVRRRRVGCAVTGLERRGGQLRRRWRRRGATPTAGRSPATWW